MGNQILTRRGLLRAAAIGGAGLAVAGCNVLDGLGASGHPLRDVMEGANTLTYRVHRFLMAPDALAKEYTKADIRQPMFPNGVAAPPDADYKALAANSFKGYRLGVGGLVDKPLSLDRETLFAMPSRTQITRHDCVEGWSCIAEWTGVPLSVILQEARPKPQARFVLIRCFDTIERGLSGEFKYYESIDMIDAYHPQTILAYGLNGGPLPVENGAPLRLRVERQLGYKMAKYVRSIELVSSFAQIEGGKGGYWEDRGYDWYAGI